MAAAAEKEINISEFIRKMNTVFEHGINIDLLAKNIIGDKYSPDSCEAIAKELILISFHVDDDEIKKLLPNDKEKEFEKKYWSY